MLGKLVISSGCISWAGSLPPLEAFLQMYYGFILPPPALILSASVFRYHLVYEPPLSPAFPCSSGRGCVRLSGK